jgi:hypothetical protein
MMYGEPGLIEGRGDDRKAAEGSGLFRNGRE